MQGTYAQAAPASAPVSSSVFTPAHAAAVSAETPPALPPAVETGDAAIQKDEEAYNQCGGPVYTPEFQYEYAAGQLYDSQLNRSFGYGSDIYQRLMLGPPSRDDCLRFLLQHDVSSTPYPDSRLSVDSMAAVYVYQDGPHTAGGYLGLGATEYSGIQNTTTADMVLELRYRIVWKLSVEGNANIPLGNILGSAIFKNSNMLNKGLGLYGISLRLDWRHVGIRAGVREIQLSSSYRNSTFTAVMLKF